MKTNNDNIIYKLSEIISILDSEITNEKTIAHNAIDMTDWDEGQKILINANKKISLINKWKASLNFLKEEMQQSDLFQCDASGADDKSSEAEKNLQCTTDEKSEEDKEQKFINDSLDQIGEGFHNQFNKSKDNESKKRTAVTINFIINDSEYSVKSWSDFIVTVCEHMILFKPYSMAIIDSFDDVYRFTRNEKDANIHMEKPFMLSNGIWLETGGTKEDIISDVYVIIKHCGFSEDNLLIEEL